MKIIGINTKFSLQNIQWVFKDAKMQFLIEIRGIYISYLMIQGYFLDLQDFPYQPAMP